MGASSEPCATAASGSGKRGSATSCTGPSGESTNTSARRSGPRRTVGPRRRPASTTRSGVADTSVTPSWSGSSTPVAAEPVARPRALTGGVAVRLGLEARGEVAPSAGRRREHRCGRAVLRRVGERGGQRRQFDGPLVGQRRGQLGQAVGVEERGVGGAVEEGRMPQHVDQQVAVGAHAVHAGAGQRVGEQRRGLTTGRRVRDDLGQHRVVEHRHRPSRRRCRSRPHAVERAELGSASGTSKRCTVPACGCQPLAGSSAYSRASIECPRDGGRFAGRGGRRRRPAAAARRGRGRWSPR